MQIQVEADPSTLRNRKSGTSSSSTYPQAYYHSKSMSGYPYDQQHAADPYTYGGGEDQVQDDVDDDEHYQRRHESGGESSDSSSESESESSSSSSEEGSDSDSMSESSSEVTLIFRTANGPYTPITMCVRYCRGLAARVTHQM